MEITTSQKDEIQIIRVDGNLDSITSRDLEKELNALLDNNKNKLLINFENLEYTSSAGLRVLLAGAKKAMRSGGALRFANLNDTIKEIFEISGFDYILNVFEDEKAALEGF